MDFNRWERTVILLLAVVIVVAFLILIFNPPQGGEATLPIIRFLASLIAGFFTSYFIGNLNIRGKLFNTIDVKAAGAFAAFIAVLLLFFYGVPTPDRTPVTQAPDPSPPVKTPSAAVAPSPTSSPISSSIPSPLAEPEPPPTSSPVPSSPEPKPHGIAKVRGYEFQLDRCAKKSTQSVTCYLSITNKLQDRDLQLDVRGSRIIDSLGHEHSAYAVHLGSHEEGIWVVSPMISEITVDASVTFSGVQQKVIKIARLDIDFDDFAIQFRDVELSNSQ